MPKARATKEPKAAVAKLDTASEVGLGAGASTAATFLKAETAMSVATMAAMSFIFKASIVGEIGEDLERGREIEIERF
ncbi:hypothetical protein QQ045_005180 [Rhodiola kirilowii]